MERWIGLVVLVLFGMVFAALVGRARKRTFFSAKIKELSASGPIFLIHRLTNQNRVCVVLSTFKENHRVDIQGLKWEFIRGSLTYPLDRWQELRDGILVELTGCSRAEVGLETWERAVSQLFVMDRSLFVPTTETTRNTGIKSEWWFEGENLPETIRVARSHLLGAKFRLVA